MHDKSMNINVVPCENWRLSWAMLSITHAVEILMTTSSAVWAWDLPY